MNHKVKLYPENIPPALIVIPQWVCYRRVPKKKDPTKWDKIPIDPKGNRNASVSDPKTWGSFEQAVSRYEKDQNISGIGIVLTTDLGIVGVDYDECLDENGNFRWGGDDVEKLNSYWEITPSDEGVRVFAFATLPPGGRKKGKIEMYNSGRFLTVTGNTNEEKKAIESRQSEITDLHNRVFSTTTPDPSNGKPKKTTSESKKRLQQPASPSGEKSKIIETIKRSKQGTLFNQLIDGKWETVEVSGKKKYPSQSEADLALLSILAFFTRKDAKLMREIFKESKLYRTKCEEIRDEEGTTYLDMSVATAIDGCEKVYDPQYNKGQVVTDEELDDIVRSLNDKHAIVMLGGKCLVLNEVRDPIFDRPDIDFSSASDFWTRYRNNKVKVFKNGNLVDKSIAEIWLDSPDRREFDGLVFDPSRKDNPRYYNLFRGYAVKPIIGSWERMKEHIFDVICDRHEESYRYIIAWMARLIQDPGGERPGVVIVMRGRQGTGKGCFVTNLGAIFGNHFLHIISHQLVGGRFNSHFKDALLVFVDEGFWGGDKQAEGVLKGMITEDYILVEPKGKEAFKIKNNSNFIFASNNSWVIPAAIEERRFFTMDVSERRMGDSSYFKAIYEEMTNGGREAMLHDLLKHDISNIDLRKFPRREALLDQIIHSLPTVKKFWYELLREGRITTTTERLKGYSTKIWPDYIASANLYELYCEFATRIGERYKVINIQFGKQIKEICPGIERKKRDNEWCQFFPTLQECRQFFEKLVKMKVDWGPEE